MCPLSFVTITRMVSAPTGSKAARLGDPECDGILAWLTEQAKLRWDFHGRSNQAAWKGQSNLERGQFGKGARIAYNQWRSAGLATRLYSRSSFSIIGSRAERPAEGSQHETQYPPRLLRNHRPLRLRQYVQQAL